MKYKYCRYENVTNAIKHSRFTIGIVIGIALMFGLIKIIPDKIFIFILPLIGGFVAGIISSERSIAVTDNNDEQQELNAGEAAGITFGIIICFVGTLLFEWTDLTEMAYLVVSPYGENSHLFSLLFIAIILILSYFSWVAILIFSLAITVCFFAHLPYSLINITYDAVFDILLANIPIMGLICGVLGSSGNKLSKMFLDCLPNLYYTIVNVNFIKRVLHALSNKFVKSFFIILIIVMITSTVILFASLKEQEEKVEFSPLEVSNIEVDTPKFEYYGIPLLKKYATEIALEDYPDVDRGYINNLVGKAASLSTANLSITLSIYNPNNKTMNLDKIDYTIYEIIPDYAHANILLRRYIKSDTYTEEAITLPPHTTTVVSLNPKLGILQSGILRLDESMLDCIGVLKVKGILYSEDSRYYFEQNTSIGELISEYVKIEIERAKHPCIITQKDWDLYYPCIKRDDYITLTIDELDRPRIDIGAYYGRYGPYVPIIFDGLAKLEYPEHYGKDYHFDNGIKEYIHLWTINYTVYCDEDDVIIEDYLRQNYGVPANITIIRK
jgi:hypothetical protein